MILDQDETHVLRGTVMLPFQVQFYYDEKFTNKHCLRSKSIQLQ